MIISTSKSLCPPNRKTKPQSSRSYHSNNCRPSPSKCHNEQVEGHVQLQRKPQRIKTHIRVTSRREMRTSAVLQIRTSYIFNKSALRIHPSLNPKALLQYLFFCKLFESLQLHHFSILLL